MIEVQYNKFSYKPLLGNNMFQYSLGRILATELGLALEAEPIPGFPNTAERIEGARYDGPAVILSGQRIDLQALLAMQQPRKLVLQGWFQRSEYYHPYRGHIREWLAFDPAIRRPTDRPAVVVHVRRADYVRLGWALPFSFYEQALSRVAPNGEPICILTDDPSDPFFDHFAPWQPAFASGTALEDLLLMTCARTIVMSQSTFSWWPTFLGAPEQVVCPVPAFGAWSQQGEASEATLIERDRFICLDVPEPYRPSTRERRHQDWRAFKRRAVLAINRRLGLALPEPPS